MSTRPRSVPPASTCRVTRSHAAAAAAATASSSSSSSLIAVHRSSTITAPISTSTDAAPPTSTTAASRLAAQADALAKMTLEMNLRSVGKQADRLERDLRTLVQATARDAAFRAQHETRLQDLWKEILAVKAHLAAAGDRDDAARGLADEACRGEARRLAEEMRGEMAGVKEMVKGLRTALSEMPSAEQMQAALSQSSVDTQDIDPNTRRKTNQQQKQQQPRSASKQSIHARIQDALRSTRRWHRDHKTTRLSDAAFCAAYLRQQSKRDAPMAVFLQRAVQRRVQARSAASTTCAGWCSGPTWRPWSRTCSCGTRRMWRRR
ncbi:hypothetical protein BBO_04160 [Beauveria brongniartii RCEF 3172]|uniref:Uncharacterized protein n=1 Tax=Beauveria brongniartii RCEF 3172 TaxID=1081107 RepID=A0A167F1L8_9HYPO|nr:hypothetical protein BBO_04160 [Beauveria brongniartii RCEF 3172]